MYPSDLPHSSQASAIASRSPACSALTGSAPWARIRSAQNQSFGMYCNSRKIKVIAPSPNVSILWYDGCRIFSKYDDSTSVSKYQVSARDRNSCSTCESTRGTLTLACPTANNIPSCRPRLYMSAASEGRATRRTRVLCRTDLVPREFPRCPTCWRLGLTMRSSPPLIQPSSLMLPD